MLRGVTVETDNNMQTHPNTTKIVDAQNCDPDPSEPGHRRATPTDVVEGLNPIHAQHA